MHTHQQSSDPVATVGVDIGKNTFHLVGLDKRGAIVTRIKVSRSQLARRLVNLPRLPHRNLLAIALANKLARIAWAVLARGRDYEPRITPNAA